MKKTPLHQNHIDLGAKTGEFAGYDMPLYYGEGVIKEHEWVRSHAGLFDVSHMGQVMLEGAGVIAFLERLTPSSFSSKKPGRAQYTVLSNDKGGIIDDLIVTRLGENRFFAVINAGRKDVDIAWMRQNLPAGVKLDYWEDRALIALQGPRAESAMKEIFGIDTSDMPYMSMVENADFGGVKVHISRLGYTGEDGFEISIPQKDAAQIWSKFLQHKDVKPIGLAARDSLRLEMGYALYGHDIDENTSPVEAGIAWIIGKDAPACFGAARIRKELMDGTSRRRVGVKLLDKGIAREGAEIRDMNDRKIGMLTSGGFSPSLKEAIGQGYVETALSDAGTKIFVNVRGRNIPAEIHTLPFIKAKTKSAKSKEAA